MKYFVLLIFFYSGSCASQPMLADSVIQESSLRETLFFLSQDSLKGRLTGGEGASIAATFIAAKFNSIGLSALGANEGFYDNFIADYERKKIPAKNVVGVIQGNITNDTMIIFSAHYDHIGQRDDLPFNKEYNSKDEIFNGANDNTTGVAALLELARYYKAQNNNHYQLVFVAFAGEEMGMLGSAHLNKKINPAIVKAVINLEMLGRPEKQSCFIVSFRNKAIRNMLN
ncbi:MAG: M20/M25/M40 family metallo-hydrolase, partial [Ferruginibacter sp.]